MTLARIALALFITMASVVVLEHTKTILIPFVVAVIVWYTIRLVQLAIKRITFRGHPLPRWVRGSLAFLVIMSTLALLAGMLINNLRNIAEVLPQYEENLRLMRQQAGERFGSGLMGRFENAASGIDLTKVLSMVLNSLTALFGNGFMVLLYAAFIMLEERYARDKLLSLSPNDESRQRTLDVLRRVDRSLAHYVTLKTGVSALTGILSYIALLVIGVDLAFFWAVVIFLLNYIPTIGSLVATVFPALIAGLQFGAPGPMLWVLGVVGAIQVVVGNILEPRLMGNSLNVSALVVILMLTFWGWLWGIVGMMLSVPITVTMVIVMAQFPATRWLAVLLSDKGQVE